MQKILLAGLALAASASMTQAAIVEFRGGACITAVTTACAADGWDIGDCMSMRYSPPNLGTNGAATELTFMNQAFGVNYGLATGTLVGTTYKPVSGVHVGRTGYTFSSSARITTQTAVSAASSSVTLIGNITNFDSTTGCTVGFRASGARKP